MSGFWNIRRLMTAAIIAATAGGTYVMAQATAAKPAAPASTAPAPAGSGAPSPDSAIATINGRDINNKVFYDTLMQVAGMRVWDHLFNLSLVQAECATNGIEFSGQGFDDRFKAELKKVIDSISGAKPDEKLDDKQKVTILNEALSRQGITGTEFNIDLQTRTNLRALSKGRVEVSEDDVKEAYQAKYGERREVRIFYVSEIEKQSAVRNALKAGKAPDQAAKDLDVPMQPGVIISKNAKGIDKAIAWIFAPTTKEKDLSAELEVPGQNGLQKVLIYVEKITPDTTAANPLNPALHTTIEQEVKDFKENQWMNQHLILLRGNATVKINDPYLSNQFENLAKALKAQADAATQPAGAGTGISPPTSGPAAPAAMPAPSGGPAPAIMTNLPPTTQKK